MIDRPVTSRWWRPIAALLSIVTLTACSAPTSGPETGGSPPTTSAPASTPAVTTPAPSTTTSAPSAAPATSSTPQGTPMTDPDLDTDLIAAAWDNDVTKARDLIARGADVNAADETEQSAFLIAASEGYTDLLRLTLAHGADVTSLDSYRGTALIRAAERGHADIVGLLIQRGTAVDHVNRLGWTALHEAIEFAPRAGGPQRGDAEDYLDTVRVLIAAGADVERAAVEDGRTPIAMARQHALERQTGLLERAAAATTADTADRDLLEAATAGDVDTATIALAQGGELETRNQLQQTPLLLASANDRTAVARLLVRLGADPDAVDHQSDTPWLVTGVAGSVAMLEILLPADPDLTARNRFGGLSPIPAAERGHADYITRVVRTDVDLDHVNDLGWTALLEAVILGDGSAPYQRIVRTLVDAGVDTSIADRDGRTALDHARSQGQREVAAILAR